MFKKLLYSFSTTDYNYVSAVYITDKGDSKSRYLILCKCGLMLERIMKAIIRLRENRDYETKDLLFLIRKLDYSIEPKELEVLEYLNKSPIDLSETKYLEEVKISLDLYKKLDVIYNSKFR